MRQMGGFEDLTLGRAAEGIEAIRQRAYHILDTAVGGLPQDTEFGWPIRDAIGVGLAPGDLRTLEAIGRAAFKRDPEIREALVTIALEDEVPGEPREGTVDVALETALGNTTITAELAP